MRISMCQNSFRHYGDCLESDRSFCRFFYLSFLIELKAITSIR
ncbi:hypothetical protein VRK_40170 [Vibrio sp. MEBiC08052]|nr:hypothetical protein VRK_40170 [Vibrio sp. MEBiC08052]